MTVHGLFWVASLCIYVLMHALMCIRPKMIVKFGFTVTDDLMSGWNSKPEGFTVHMNSDTKLKFWCETVFGRVIQVELLVFDH